MTDGEGRDFILLCEAILEDGEVSAEEAYKLAEWLNTHPAVGQSWPGRELIKPLQEIWADGTVNRRELERVARLLVTLQREGAAHGSETLGRAPEIALPKFALAATSGATLPSLDAHLQIRSSSEASVVHEVDLIGPKCSCPEWRERRSHLPANHLTRCCKHILAAYAQLPRAPEVDRWLLAYIDNGWPADPRTDWELISVEKEKVLISSAANKGWANVFAKDEGEYKRFGYHPKEHRWAYGSEPRWAWVITDAIRSLDEAARSRRPTSLPLPANEKKISKAWILIAVAAGVGAIALSRCH